MISSSTERLVDVVLPAMGTSVTEGTIVCWSKTIGDRVEADESICEISTDKVDTECPSPAAGVLAEIRFEAGETIDVGTVIARIAVADGDFAVSAATNGDSRATAVALTVTKQNQPGGDAAANGRARRYSPVVTRMAETLDLDLTLIPGTGRAGRVTKGDVLRYLEREPEERPLHSESPYRPDADAPSGPRATTSLPQAESPDVLGGRSEAQSRMRRLIGSAMRHSLETAATCHTVVECDTSRIEVRRAELGMTALPLVSCAVVETLRRFPELNATLDGNVVTRYERVHLGIAVSLGAEGLIVPVIRDAQNLSAEGLGHQIKDLALRARAKQLNPDDVRGATFTITNPGAAGAILATPIIAVPQVAILDLEAIVRRPIVVSDADGNESIAIRPMVNLILGWDHRAIDGIYAAQFLTALRRRLEGAA